MSTQIASQGPLYVMGIMFVAGCVWARCSPVQESRTHVHPPSGGLPSPPPSPASASNLPSLHWMYDVVKGILGMVGYTLALVLSVETPILMQRSIQQNLDPMHRTAVLSAGAFLTPFEEIFVFLEDTMLVRINYAMGSGETRLVNQLLNVGVFLGLVSGVLAALVATGLSVNLAVFTPLVYPGGDHGSGGGACSLIQPAATVAAAARSYFLLSAWQWPFAFINKTLSGFYLGSGSFLMYGWPSVLRATATLAIWFGGLSMGVEDTFTLLGLSYFVGPPLSTALFAAAIAIDKPLRTKYGIHLLHPCASGSNGWFSAGEVAKRAAGGRSSSRAPRTGSEMQMRLASPGAPRSDASVEQIERDAIASMHVGIQMEHARVARFDEGSQWDRLPSTRADCARSVADSDSGGGDTSGSGDANSDGDPPVASRFHGRTTSGTGARDWRRPAPTDAGGLRPRELLMGSLKAMVVDLCQQASLTTGIYIAAAQGLGVSYQVAAMQSAMPEFGQAWTVGLALAVKLTGPQMIGAGEPRLFVRFAVGVLAFAAACSLISGVAAVVPFGEFLASNYGETACGYATEEGCLPIYRSIFSAPDPLATSFSTSFSAAVTLNCMYLIAKAVLYALMDFDFMCIVSLASLLLVFLPAILAAIYVYEASATAIFLAMYCPHILLLPVFGYRIFCLCHRLYDGQPGPWSQFSQQASGAGGMAARTAVARRTDTVPIL